MNQDGEHDEDEVREQGNHAPHEEREPELGRSSPPERRSETLGSQDEQGSSQDEVGLQAVVGPRLTPDGLVSASIRRRTFERVSPEEAAARARTRELAREAQGDPPPTARAAYAIKLCDLEAKLCRGEQLSEEDLEFATNYNWLQLLRSKDPKERRAAIEGLQEQRIRKLAIREKEIERDIARTRRPARLKGPEHDLNIP